MKTSAPGNVVARIRRSASSTSFDPETSGKVRAIYEVQITEDDGDPLAPGEVGEILVRPRARPSRARRPGPAARRRVGT
jgi:hypothetical protein